jgi:hypothetical protein
MSTREARYANAGSPGKIAGVLISTAVLTRVPTPSLKRLRAPTEIAAESEIALKVKLKRSMVKRFDEMVVGKDVADVVEVVDKDVDLEAVTVEVDDRVEVPVVVPELL